MFHTKFFVSRLQNIFDALRKTRPQSVKLKSSQSDNDTPRNNSGSQGSVKLKSSQSDNDRPRNNSGKGCNQTDTLLGKMKITQKKGAELFHTKFSVLRLQNKFDALRKTRPQSVKLKSSQSDDDRPRNNSGKGCHQTDT